MWWSLVLVAALPCGGGHGRADPVAALARADASRAAGRAARDPRLLVRGASCAALAAGAVFDVDGGAASTDLAARIAEARALAPDDAALAAALDALPTDRGRTGGASAIAGRAVPGQPWRRRLVFDGGDMAVLYLRSGQPARMVVRDSAGQVRCDARRASGRVLCRWLPTRQGAVEVDVTIAARGTAEAAFDLFTN